MPNRFALRSRRLLLGVLLALPAAAGAEDEVAVELEEAITTYLPANNGAGPLWCYGAPLVVRRGDEVLVSALETGDGVPPLSNTRWQLWRRGAEGWTLEFRPEGFREREPCPIGILADGTVWLSANPSTEPPGTQYGPCRPQVLRFAPGRYDGAPAAEAPAWEGAARFTDHSYRGLAVDRERGEVLLLNIDAETSEQHVSLRDAKGAWRARGRIRFPIRAAYPQAALRGGAAHVLAIGDIVEPNEDWRRLKREATGREWDYVFRRLFYAFAPRVAEEGFQEPIEIASVESTGGHIQNLDLHVDRSGAAHVLYLERPHVHAAIRDRYFAGQEMTRRLEYALLRGGRVVARRRLAAGPVNERGALDPAYARFHVAPGEELWIVAAGQRRSARGEAESGDFLAPLGAAGAAPRWSKMPLRHPFGTFFTAAPRGGSEPSDLIDLYGASSDAGTLRYARARIGRSAAAAAPALAEIAIGGTLRARVREIDPSRSRERPRVLVVAGLDGSPASSSASSSAAAAIAARYESAPGAAARERLDLAVVAAARGDASAGAADRAPAFPPRGRDYYAGLESSAAGFLWRWIGVHAPDLVIEIASGPERRAAVPAALRAELEALARALAPEVEALDSGEDLISALSAAPAIADARVPGVRLEVPSEDAAAAAERVLAALLAAPPPPSPLRKAIAARAAREPLAVAGDLAAFYGKDLDSVQYIPAVALIARLRWSDLLGADEAAAARAVVDRAVAPFLVTEREALPERFAGSHLSGHLVFAELARRGVAGERLRRLVLRVAELGFDASGDLREAMPAHEEMSDAVFMACPILAEAAAMTGERRYADLCARHFRFLDSMLRRPDGLYRHSPLDPTAWGRGNAFVLLGLAWSLSALAGDEPRRGELLDAYLRLLGALERHQDAAGVWRQVIDEPASFAELSATCMIAWSVARGLRRGWLDEGTYAPLLERAWGAAKLRIGRDGALVDVCAGTGKQQSLDAYLARPAILGRDARGGAMAFLVAVEMAALETERRAPAGAGR
jgi:hypothetical protein